MLCVSVCTLIHQSTPKDLCHMINAEHRVNSAQLEVLVVIELTTIA